MIDTLQHADTAPELKRVDWKRVERLEWVQPKALRDRWELHADDGVAARLSNRGLWKRGWDAESAGTRWLLQEPLLFGSPSIAREGDAEPVVWAKTRLLAPQPIERAAGPTLGWTLDWSSGSRVLATLEKHALVVVKPRLRWLRAEATIRLEDAGRELPDLEPLLLLCWALQVTRRRHAH